MKVYIVIVEKNADLYQVSTSLEDLGITVENILTNLHTLIVSADDAVENIELIEGVKKVVEDAPLELIRPVKKFPVS